MKKLLLGLGTIAAVVAPVSAVIACDMGTLEMTTDTTTSLTEDALQKAVEALQANKPADYPAIKTALGLSDSLYTQDSGSTIKFTDITYKNKVVTIKAKTTTPVSATNSEETTMDFNQVVNIMSFGSKATI